MELLTREAINFRKKARENYARLRYALENAEIGEIDGGRGFALVGKEGKPLRKEHLEHIMGAAIAVAYREAMAAGEPPVQLELSD